MLADPVAAPEELGLSRSRLARIDALFERFIDRGVIAGAVALIARNGRLGHLGAYGHMDVESGRAMRPNTIFRMASMTKPVVSVAILTLVEEGVVLLNDTVSTYIPAFKEQLVAVP